MSPTENTHLDLLDAVATELGIVLEKMEKWDLPGITKRVKTCRARIVRAVGKARKQEKGQEGSPCQ